MKKLILATSFTLLCAPLAQADTIFGVYAGVGSWMADADGTAGDPSVSLNELGVEKHANNYFYIAIEHPVPLVPNLRVQQNNINSQQTATITRSFTIDGTNFVVGENIHSDFDLSHTDATLYYEILDNWVNIDIGVTARKFKGYVEANSSTRSKKVDIDQTLPLTYAKLQFDLPFSGLSAGFEGNYISYKENDLTDYSAKLSYLFDSAFDVGVEVGYRKMAFNVDESDMQGDFNLKGPYAALIAHF